MTLRSLTSTGCTTGTDHQLSPADGAGSVARDLGPRTQVMPKRARRPHPQRRAIRSLRLYSLSCSEDMRLRIRRPGVRIPPSAQPREPRSTATTAVLAGFVLFRQESWSRGPISEHSAFWHTPDTRVPTPTAGSRGHRPGGLCRRVVRAGRFSNELCQVLAAFETIADRDSVTS
jgi:hypothetical protein